MQEIFAYNSSGMTSERDYITIQPTLEAIKNIVRLFKTYTVEKLEELFKTKDSRDWKISNAKKDILKNYERDLYQKIHYKPFEYLWTFYSGQSRGFIGTPSFKMMSNFINKENRGIIITKRYYDKNFSHCFITENLTNRSFLGGQSYIFPLWIFESNGDVFNGNGKYKNQVSNLNPKIETLLENTYNKQNITEQIFYYIYAVLYSNTYRNSFTELLKIDYPKIPFTRNVEIFEQVAKLGKELADLHLLKSPSLNKPKVKFIGQGNGKVDKPEFNESQHIITINETQYFDNISNELWEFKVGKNQVIKQWLTRKEKIEFEDAIEFSRIATAIYETFKLQSEIDAIYPEIIKELLEKE